MYTMTKNNRWIQFIMQYSEQCKGFTDNCITDKLIEFQIKNYLMTLIIFCYSETALNKKLLKTSESCLIGIFIHQFGIANV